jgi:hypothetical protein
MFELSKIKYLALVSLFLVSIGSYAQDFFTLSLGSSTYTLNEAFFQEAPGTLCLSGNKIQAFRAILSFLKITDSVEADLEFIDHSFEISVYQNDELERKIIIEFCDATSSEQF